MTTKFSRRDFLKTTGIAAAASVLAACQPAANTQPTAAPAKAEKKKITFTMYGHPGLIELMVPKFNEANPDIELTFERSEGQGYGEKLAAAIAGGTAWDCFRIGQADSARFGSKGAVIDLKPLQEVDKIYPASEYMDGALAAFEINGKRYGMPVFALNFFMFYNKKLFDEAGVPYPTSKMTWDEFVQTAKKMTKTDSNGNITQYGSAGFGGWWGPIASHVWTAGGHWYYNDDMTAFKMDDPETISALQAEADMMNIDKSHPSPLNPPTTPATIMSGKVAMELNGAWYPWDQKDTWKEEFGAFQFPLINGKRVNAYGTDPLVVSAASKNQEAAYRWIAWFACSKEASIIQGRVVFPINKKAYSDPEISKAWLIAPYPTELINEALDHTTTGKWWQVEPHVSEFENTIFYPEIDKVWRNVETAADACKIMTEKGNELLKKPIE